MFFSLCFSFLIFGSSAQAEDPPAEAAPAATEASNAIGEKGAWADSMKVEFLKSCNAGRPESISAPVMNNICTCSLNKLEKIYAPQELGTPEAIKKAEEAGASCAMGSKGAWSDLIKQQFMQGCESSKPEGITAPAMKNICSCSMTMIEGKYGPEELQSKEATDFSAKAGEVCATQELSK